MGYVNVGARLNGQPIPTKAALKRAVAAGEEVEYYPTSLFNEGQSLEGQVLTVVGPDPLNNRKWYATVKNGRVS